jgi:hypothetical protein
MFCSLDNEALDNLDLTTGIGAILSTAVFKVRIMIQLID